MKKCIFILLCIFIFQPSVYAQETPPEIHCKHFFYGYPLGTPKTNDLIIRDTYALSNNDTTKFADWVCYRLTMHEVEGLLDLNRKWRADPWLSAGETLEPDPDDYQGAHDTLKTDRGHQAPLASFKGTRYASQVNYLSNITPQKSDLNQGPWMRLESSVRDIVKQGNIVYVMTGPLYETAMPAMPGSDEPHKVPSGYWKIVILSQGDFLPGNTSFETAAFIFSQNTPREDKVIDHLTTINIIEQKSGLNFLWEMDDTKEETVENSKNQEWAEEWF